MPPSRALSTAAASTVSVGENCKIGTIIRDEGVAKYNFGSVYGGGYGNIDYNAPSYNLEFSATSGGNTIKYTPELVDNNVPVTSPAVQLAGRVFGNASVTMGGGQVYENVYGGGDLASVGTAQYNTSGVLQSYATGTGACTVTMTDGEVGPLAMTGLNG